MEKIEKIKFGVLGGGYSNEKNISLKSAKAVNEAFFNEGLKSKLIEISIISESVIQTNFTITVQAYISEESISICL